MSNDFEDLENRLFEIPVEKFTQVVGLLQELGDKFVAQALIDRIRPRLVQVRPERRLTIERLLCTPFEPLLYSAPTLENRFGRLWRGVIKPCWSIIQETASPDSFDGLAQRLRSADRRSIAVIDEIGRLVWQTCATLLDQGLVMCEADPDMRKRLFNDNEALLRQAHDVAELLEIAEPLEELKRKLPGGKMRALSKDDIATLKEQIVAVAKQGPNKPYYLMLMAATRLTQPGDLLMALRDMDLKDEPFDKYELVSKLAEFTVGDLRQQCTSFKDNVGEGHQPVAVAGLAARMIDGLAAAETVADKLITPAMKKQLAGLRQEIKGLVSETIVAKADEKILSVVSAMPIAVEPGKNPYANIGPMVAAEEHIRALRDCTRFAPSLGMEKEVAGKLQAIGSGIEGKAKSLLNDVKSGKLKAETPQSLQVKLFNAVRMLELVSGPGKAEQLRREGAKVLEDALRRK